ncbi:uncharacterized protein CC84DRAFT_1182130 [Paraphaeosphaeria sporulosa]|uniref:Uncharacterized protein n=1 Tax=Paraphaeosphaeria sporulosa TaxID=1460663 RepID=A0A177BTN5_9PLEO|nr:uncharacterized protein CC84DRAFT_1182130 [Paraphaeosphaeria sporulosa]OAF98525.1 hypothetical protein CC84DRAFT_1182130 [Paraphaeosphaeria sporulosa]
MGTSGWREQLIPAALEALKLRARSLVQVFRGLLRQSASEADEFPKKAPGRLQVDDRGEILTPPCHRRRDPGNAHQNPFRGIAIVLACCRGRQGVRYRLTASPQDTMSLGKASKKREQTSNATPGLTSAEQAMSSELKGPKNAMLKELSVVASVQGAFEKTEDHLRGLHRATAVIRETSAQLSNRLVGV